ncbi:SDR family oxidoreductase [Granulicella arctica]|uniref:SDR family oxidoreductase n=1 Tax=Granulicella arctica TaxID=940613 RepID=UPI0021E0A7C3|nr:SDR family oxidoreductase [Granulicella arctica]
MTAQRVLVAGASGRLGQMVLQQLQTLGASRIIATSRTPQKLAAFASSKIDVRAADFNNPRSLPRAFSGVDRMLLISTDDLFSGQRVQQHKSAIEAAQRAGVRHIVYTSMPDPQGSKAIPFAPDHIATEAALEGSGMGYTILRVAWYSENPIDLGLIPSAIRTGIWLTSAGAGKIAYVPRFDVARAAAAALLHSDEGNKVYDLTGPETLTAEQLANSLATVSRKFIQVRQMDDETLGRELVASGVPAQLAPMLVTTDANTREGHFNLATTSVKDLTGTPAASFEEFLWKNKQELTLLAAH